jgi:hypothetical protein
VTAGLIRQCLGCGRGFAARSLDYDNERCERCGIVEPTAGQRIGLAIVAERNERLAREARDAEVAGWRSAGWTFREDGNEWAAVNRGLRKRLASHSLEHLLERLGSGDYAR